jgi:GrpB-like predicted nucleotidyltransferase (UPF0157 family)
MAVRRSAVTQHSDESFADESFHDESFADECSDTVFIGGPESRPIVVAPYDGAWADRFAAERDRILAALGDAALRVEHIGSTSVPGLAAKPVIDVLGVVPEVETESAYRPALEGAGYLLRVREPGHRMFRTPERDVHVHLWSSGDDEIPRHLLLRDWLRVDTADRGRYESVKRELAARTWRDTNEYARAKSSVIAEILLRAEAWAAEGEGNR